MLLWLRFGHVLKSQIFPGHPKTFQRNPKTFYNIPETYEKQKPLSLQTLSAEVVVFRGNPKTFAGFFGLQRKSTKLAESDWRLEGVLLCVVFGLVFGML